MNGSPGQEREASIAEIRPRLVALLFCDYANQTTLGKYNLLGTFNHVLLADPLEREPMFFAYVHAVGIRHGTLTVTGYNPDGTVGLRWSFEANTSEEALAQPGTVELLFPFTIQPKDYGIHWFVAEYDGQLLGNIPLFVHPREQASAPTEQASTPSAAARQPS